MIQVVSISLQLSGAVILLLWCLKGTSKEQIVRKYFPGSNTVKRDDEDNCVLKMVSPTHILFLCATESLSCEIVRFSHAKNRLNITFRRFFFCHFVRHAVFLSVFDALQELHFSIG